MVDTKDAEQFIKDADKQNGVEIVNGVDAKRLRSYVERIEYVLDQIKGLQNDLKDLKAEIKSNNFEVKAVMQLVKLRAKDKNELAEEEFIIETYRKAMNI